MKEFFLAILDFLGLAYWIEIVTDRPKCTYYFGPFVSKLEAEAAHAGYLEDLHSEGAQDIKLVLRRCKPNHLTIFEESEAVPLQGRALFSRQAF